MTKEYQSLFQNNMTLQQGYLLEDKIESVQATGREDNTT